jgi:fructose-specific phosphotransferase system IIA component
MNLTDLLSPDVIKIPLEETNKENVIREMVDILNDTGLLKNRDDVLDAVYERERVMSTGVGDGVAIPHAKTDGVDKLIAAFGVTKEPVEFQSIDNKPVRIIFLLLGPPDLTSPQLKALSRISRLMHRSELRNELIAAHNGEQVIQCMSNEEQKYFAI